MRAAVYCRLSKKKTDDDNIDQQRERGLAVVKEQGWTLAGVYVDDGASAWQPNGRRPDFERLLAVVESGAVDIIVARDQSRLERNKLDDARLTMAGVDVYLWHEDPQRQPYGNLVSDIRSIVNRDYARQISKNRKLAEQRRAEKGLPNPGGHRPFGYHSGTCCPEGCDRMTIRDDEAIVLREVADRYLAGEPITRLAFELNDRGIPTSGRGKGWSWSSLRRTLLSPSLVARRVHNGEEYPGVWEPILTDDQHRRLLAASRSKDKRRAAVAFLLTGVLYCHCGARMHGTTLRSPHRAPQRRYRCALTPTGDCRNGIGAEPVEDALWNLALGKSWRTDRLDRRRLADDLQQVEADLRDARGSLAEWDDLLSDGEVTRKRWARQVERVDERIARLEDRATQLRRDRETRENEWAALHALATAHREASFEERRRILRGTLARVVVAPARGGGRVDLNRLRIEWVDGTVTDGIPDDPRVMEPDEDAQREQWARDQLDRRAGAVSRTAKASRRSQRL